MFWFNVRVVKDEDIPSFSDFNWKDWVRILATVWLVFTIPHILVVKDISEALMQQFMLPINLIRGIWNLIINITL